MPTADQLDELAELEIIEGEERYPRATIDQLKAGIPFAEAEVRIPELRVTVLVRALSASKRAKLTNGLLDSDGKVRSIPELQARMFAASVVDPPVSIEDAREIAQTWPAPAWDRVTGKVDELSPRPKEVRSAAAAEFPTPDD